MTRVIPFPRSLLPDEKYQRLLSLFGETMARLIAVENDNTTLKTNVERLAGVNVVLTCRLTEVEASMGWPRRQGQMFGSRSNKPLERRATAPRRFING